MITQHVYIDSSLLSNYRSTAIPNGTGKLVCTVTNPDTTLHFDTSTDWFLSQNDETVEVYARSNGVYWNGAVQDRYKGRTVDIAIGNIGICDLDLFFDVATYNSLGVFVATERIHIIIHSFEELSYSVERNADGIDVWGDDLNVHATKLVENTASIMSSIDDIVFTAYGERPSRPDYGSPVPSAVWSTITASKADFLLDGTLSAITAWEHRVRVDKQRAGIDINRALNTVILTIPILIKQTGKVTLYRRQFSYGSEA